MKIRLKTKQANLSAILLVCLLLPAGGCESDSANRLSLWEQNEQLRQSGKDLKAQVEKLRDDNKELKEQVKVLARLAPEIKLENLYDLRQIRITRYSNLYDKDKDGQYEKLIVYIKPIDETGDAVKVTGTVDVQLWDLNRPAEEALLAKWNVKPAELKELWFGTLLNNFYRLTFDVGAKLTDRQEELTVKATFTDYLTGRILKAQRVIKP